MSITTIVYNMEEILRQLDSFVSKLQSEVSIIESNPYEYLKSRINSFYSFDTYLSDRKVITLENIRIDDIEMIRKINCENIKLNITLAENIDVYEETIPEFELNGVIKPITKGLEFACFYINNYTKSNFRSISKLYTLYKEN